MAHKEAVVKSFTMPNVYAPSGTVDVLNNKLSACVRVFSAGVAITAVLLITTVPKVGIICPVLPKLDEIGYKPAVNVAAGAVPLVITINDNLNLDV